MSPISLALAGRNRGPATEQLHQRVLTMPNMRTVRVTPPPPGSSPSVHLGEAQLAALGVGGDAVVAGQRDLQAAAERGAVDRGDDRLAERLQRAQICLDPLDQLESAARRSPGVTA